MKRQTIQLDDPNYDPNRLLDAVIRCLGVKNDMALSRELDVLPSTVSRIRHRRRPVAASLMLQIHEATHLSFEEIRCLMGMSTSPHTH